MLAPGVEAALGLLEGARERATTSFDPNCRPVIGPDVAVARTQAERFVTVSDIVKASDEDLAWLYRTGRRRRAWQPGGNLGPALVALMRGASGPVILTRQGSAEMAAEPVSVADTGGAGDSFMAALICGLDQLAALGRGGRQRIRSLSRDELQALAAYANHAAAITCARRGQTQLLG